MPFDDRPYRREVLVEELGRCFPGLGGCPSLEEARRYLLAAIQGIFSRNSVNGNLRSTGFVRVRDCARVLSGVLGARSEARSGFSVARALWDLAAGRLREDLQAGFCAELINWIRGLQGLVEFEYMGDIRIDVQLSGRAAAMVRSHELDQIWKAVESRMARFGNGLSAESRYRRRLRRRQVQRVLGASDADWEDWRWHIGHIVADAETLGRLVTICDEDRESVERALSADIPFGITPYYVSLMDDPASGRDRAIRAQVIPPRHYVDCMAGHGEDRSRSCDFMMESDTSPIDLVTRRYPAIAILKPYMTCPQVCVYCQRNWAIEKAMSGGALADEGVIEGAVEWIRGHPAIREVLITGGDPLALEDEVLADLLDRLSAIPHVDFIRVGTRTPVTLPMRITEALAGMLAGFRQPGRRDVAVVTHIEHPYEVTEDLARAVDRLRSRGIAVYNQHVYTFHVSRRFEGALLRMLLRRVGVDPYYTFVPKGKEETNEYRVPIARLMQEQKEEARLIPGMRRTDEVVYNVPGVGKNYLRAVQHRDLVTVLADGTRMYEFHPWEKNLMASKTYLASDVPILDYLARLAEMGEDPREYDSIWFYY